MPGSRSAQATGVGWSRLQTRCTRIGRRPGSRRARIDQMTTCEAGPCDSESGLPAGGAAVRRRSNCRGLDAAACDDPRGDRVGVPHLAGRKLVPTPDRSRDVRDLHEYTSRTLFVVAQPPGTVHRVGDIGKLSTVPTTDFVAENPEPTRPATADGAFGDDAPLLAVEVWDRRLLDDERSLWYVHLERGVVEVAGWTALDRCHQRLVDATAEREEGPVARSHWQPVQVDGGSARRPIVCGQVSVACRHGASIAGRNLAGIASRGRPGRPRRRSDRNLRNQPTSPTVPSTVGRTSGMSSGVLEPVWQRDRSRG